MLETLLTMVLKIVLDWLQALVIKQINAAVAQAKKDNTNLENSDKYKSAKTRLEKIHNAKHLLNRTHNP